MAAHHALQDRSTGAPPSLVYQSVNQAVLDSIPPHALSVLDIGCGGGLFGAALKASRSCTVLGVTFSEAEAELARARLDRVEVADLNSVDPAFLGRHDCIICSHVLEHLHDPRRLLLALQACLAPCGTLVVALPNVLHWKQRLQFARGQFRYTEGGLMDHTHYRFFDWFTAAELLQQAGYRIESRRADGNLPLSRWLGTALCRRADRTALSLLPGLFGTQFVLCAGSRADRGAAAGRGNR
jgi:SAM-dependent methyltransferase